MDVHDVGLPCQRAGQRALGVAFLFAAREDVDVRVIEQRLHGAAALVREQRGIDGVPAITDGEVARHSLRAAGIQILDDR